MINIIVAVGICARNSIIFPLLGDLGRRTGSLRAVGDPDGDAYARCTHACVAEGWKRVHKITSLAVACLTIYDMVKALERGMRIEGIRLLEKRGGRSGHYRAEE